MPASVSSLPPPGGLGPTEVCSRGQSGRQGLGGWGGGILATGRDLLLQRPEVPSPTPSWTSKGRALTLLEMPAQC